MVESTYRPETHRRGSCAMHCVECQKVRFESVTEHWTAHACEEMPKGKERIQRRARARPYIGLRAAHSPHNQSQETAMHSIRLRILRNRAKKSPEHCTVQSCVDCLLAPFQHQSQSGEWHGIGENGRGALLPSFCQRHSNKQAVCNPEETHNSA